MSTSLDDRARRAADGLQRAVATVAIDESRIPGVPRARSFGPGRSPGWSMAAGALAAALVIGGVSLVRAPEVVAPVAEVDPTSVPATSVPVVTEPLPTTPVTVPPTTASAPPTTVVDTQPPLIEITFPKPGFVSEEKTITFEGRTERGASVHAGPYEATVAADGTWQITLILSEGSTTATFVAEDAAGNKASASVTVGYEKPVVSTTTTEKPVKEFSAYNTYGSCELDPPYDVYYGTGQPGTKIKVVSDYGSGSTIVGEGGGWELKVFFPEAPPGVPFVVNVSDAFGNKKSFEFVSLVGV